MGSLFLFRGDYKKMNEKKSKIENQYIILRVFYTFLFF